VEGKEGKERREEEGAVPTREGSAGREWKSRCSISLEKEEEEIEGNDSGLVNGRDEGEGAVPHTRQESLTTTVKH
jgi:hypothetical protein